MKRKYSPKASEKIGQTMHEFKRGKLKSGGSGKKVTSRKQAIAIGISQAQRAGYKVPPLPRAAHARKKPPAQLDREIAAKLAAQGQPTLAAVFADPQARKTFAREMRHEIQKKQTSQKTEAALAARPFTVKRLDGTHRELFGRHATEAEARAVADKIGGWVEHEGRVVYGRAPSDHARRRSRRSHATKDTGGTLFAVEIDRSKFAMRDLPADARWRDDLVHVAEKELGRGRTYRRPKDARYAAIEWTGHRGAVGRLLDWLEAAAGITRYAEIFE